MCLLASRLTSSFIGFVQSSANCNVNVVMLMLSEPYNVLFISPWLMPNVVVYMQTVIRATMNWTVVNFTTPQPKKHVPLGYVVGSIGNDIGWRKLREAARKTAVELSPTMIQGSFQRWGNFFPALHSMWVEISNSRSRM